MVTAAKADRTLPDREDRWLTLGGACRILGVDESTLRRWADNGHVRAFRTPGGHRRFAESDIHGLVSGRAPDAQHYRELGEMAVTRIRRQLHARSAQEAPWYATVDERIRERLRPLGRHLAALAADYLSRRTRRTALLDDARELGRDYGRELATAGLPLAQAVEAFTFFRRSLDGSTKQATQRHGLSADEALGACEQVNTLADQVLIGMTEAYEQPVPARVRSRGSR
ncbi:MAG: helix-turn-helix domain-containing protein [Dehalococcoidia bacterium]